MADVAGTDVLSLGHMASAARSVALRGELVWLIREDGRIPRSDWELRTRYGGPVAYRLSISEAGGGTTQTALAGEVLHFRIGPDPVTPWLGTPPLRRASLTAGLLNAVEFGIGRGVRGRANRLADCALPRGRRNGHDGLGSKLSRPARAGAS